MKTICSFQFELTQKLKQLNIKFLIIPLVKREAEQKYKLNKYKWSKQTCHVLHHVPYLSQILSFL